VNYQYKIQYFENFCINPSSTLWVFRISSENTLKNMRFLRYLLKLTLFLLKKNFFSTFFYFIVKYVVLRGKKLFYENKVSLHVFKLY